MLGRAAKAKVFETHERAVLLGFAAFYFAAPMLSALALRFTPMTDLEQCVSAARRLLDANQSGLSERSLIYLGRNPHNMGVIYLFCAIFRAADLLGADQLLCAALVCSLLFTGGLLCAAMLCAAPALAMPGMGEGKAPVDKFPMMDADKDGSVSKEEFKKFFPQMQDGAFAAIDKNKDGAISHEEWQGFSKSHAMGRAGHPDAQMPPAGEAAPKTMPLVTPPSK